MALTNQGAKLAFSKFVRKQNKFYRQIVQTSTYVLFERIVERSPVDTGLFRGSWRISYTLNGNKVNTLDKEGAATLELAERKLERWVTGDPIYIVNRQPYYERLEFEGWSQQAPAGMVRISLVEFPDIIRAVKEQFK